MPKVSVILPVYNAEKYLAAAIDSILQQTFTDFELLLINDGSTDSSEQIIQRYNDPRIVYVRNESNQGLIYSLNKAIDLAKGEYIARMDADDVALPERFSEQTTFLDNQKNVGIVATVIDFINETDSKIGNWELDVATTSPKAIRNTMPFECCIAHPSVMGKTTLFKKYKYDPKQSHIEDYDLWLRMLDDGIVIDKIKDPLLLYRTHSASITQSANVALLPQARMIACKQRYLKEAISKRKLTLFNLRVGVSLLRDHAVWTKKRILG